MELKQFLFLGKFYFINYNKIIYLLIFLKKLNYKIIELIDSMFLNKLKKFYRLYQLITFMKLLRLHLNLKFLLNELKNYNFLK